MVTDANGNVATKRELSALDRVLYVGGERLRINLRHCRGRLIGLRPMMQPTGQAAERLQFSKQTVLRLIRAGELRAERIQPGAQYRILEDDLTEYAERRGVTLSPDQEKQNRPGR